MVGSKLVSFPQPSGRVPYTLIFFLALPLALPGATFGQPPPATLTVTVLDENLVPVPSARVRLVSSGAVAGATPLQSETDYAGRCEFNSVAPGRYTLRVEKEGFYALVDNVVVAGHGTLEVTLNHQHEFIEHVKVSASPPAIDPQKTASSDQLGSREIIDLPFQVPRDFRYGLPLLPHVLQDATGQVHVAGSDTRETFDTLDGFQINAPASGLLTLRLNVDAIRAIEIDSSRCPAEFGKGSGGVLSLTTGMGDDHFRFSGTDFLPSLQTRGGLHVNNWTPRGSLAGPLRQGRAWFLVAPEAEYDLTVIPELPPGADRNSAWRFGNLAKAQVNLTPSNILTTTGLVNRFDADHAGLSRFNPVETTLNLDQSADILSVKDQTRLASGLLLEAGLAVSRFRVIQNPLGNQTYVISPEGTKGNFFEAAAGHSKRVEGLANLVVPPWRAWGKHELKLGTDLESVSYHQSYHRNPFQIVREDGTLSRRVAFTDSLPFAKDNFAAAVYAQDRWFVSDRLLVEPGLRLDRDDLVRSVLLSPRIAATYLLALRGDTKLVAGLGRYYDATNLVLVTLPLAGQRTDYFYDRTGTNLIAPPGLTAFQIGPGQLKAARFLNWSAGVERKLPGSIYSRLEFLEKRGSEGLTFVNGCSSALACYGGIFQGASIERDRYTALTLTVRRSIGSDHMLFASYTRSSARTNAAMFFSLDNPVFSPQQPGPLPWDAPNRFISWGFLPLVRGFDLAYIADARSGFPFNVVNQNQQLVGPPGSRRFPTFFSLNLAIERRFTLFGYQWALRAGVDDVTNRHNPFAVDNNIDSPHFMTFSAIQGRVLTGRIRLLGRK
jgi:hypothetical protein